MIPDTVTSEMICEACVCFK